MRILYDGQIYVTQNIGGISRYFTNIINLLPQDFHPTLTTPHQKNKLHYPTHQNLNLRECWGFRPHQISHRLQACYFRWISNSSLFDIHHPTYYTRLTQDNFSKKHSPLVITVYDMIHELFADTIEPQGHTIRAKQDAIAAADAILCISHSTKADLLHYYPDVEAKTTVTHLASEFSSDWVYGDEPIPSAPYFLYVGSRTKSYKNFDTLLIAFSKAASVNYEIYLSVVGAAFNDDEQQLITELKLADRIQHYHCISDIHLAKLYHFAEAFIYPSLYEGFGIPLLEAMACGTAVVAADSSSIPEVVSDAAILFNPKAVNDLADILLRLLESPSERDQLIMKGYKQVQKFSWNTTANQTIQVYKTFL
jgi:glycosyltransferase involved in cell wall biosynthesis